MHSSCHYLTRIVCPNFVWYVMSLGSTTSTSSPYIYIHSTFSEGERHQNNLTIETWLKLVAQILNILDHLLWWYLQLQSISTQHMTTFNHRRQSSCRTASVTTIDEMSIFWQVSKYINFDHWLQGIRCSLFYWWSAPLVWVKLRPQQ